MQKHSPSARPESRSSGRGERSLGCDAHAKGALVCDEENFSFPEEYCLQPLRFIFPEESRLRAFGEASLWLKGIGLALLGLVLI